MTKTAIAEGLGISRRRVSQLAAEGMPTNDIAAAIQWRENRQHRRIRPGARLADSDPAVRAQTIEEIKTALAAATDYESAKILSEKLSGLMLAEKLKRQLAELVPVEVAAEGQALIEKAIRAAITQLCSAETAAMLTGLPAAEGHRVLMMRGHEILQKLADEDSAFWK